MSIKTECEPALKVDTFRDDIRHGRRISSTIRREQIMGAVARGWCHDKNSHKRMDPDLAIAITDEIETLLKTH